VTAPDSNGFCPDGQHNWGRMMGITGGGWPVIYFCTRCPAKASEPFCRSSMADKCHAAGRCMSDPVCND
jgi:hypothetical protein